MMETTVAVIGAGNRGNLYSDFAKLYPEKMRVVAVAEPDEERRDQFVQKHQIHSNNIYATYDALLEKEKFCDAVIVATQDNEHFQPVMQALNKGYHVLVEKPMSPSIDECYAMVRKSKQNNKLLLLAYVLRYTPFFQRIKQLIDEHAIGDVRHISIDMNVAYWHQAHSFVRGNWRNLASSSPMILAKACHDFDIIHYLIDSRCQKISSFGELTHFRKENAPSQFIMRCLDRCHIEKDCPYSAEKIYLQNNIEWPVNTITNDLSIEARLKAIETGPYGRCVYHCDNDVVDHQIVNMQFNNKSTATITMSGFTDKLERYVRLLGTHGEISGEFSSNQISLKPFGKKEMIYQVNPATYGMHAGGDFGLMEQFCKQMTASVSSNDFYDSEDTILSHIYAHMAETSRLNGETVYTSEYIPKLAEAKGKRDITRATQ
ncbi:hypothetical protein BKP35_10710 [Anaerobacillus arseniciselenatis]|uniref:Oxidoreductase n=1 Tax=Anaerobacillus arseniciselenatis TaxID=85682 RepID=A0A1S2LIB3_9BACI|nr:Gfo/Idh/MocA family oxidoreductase [Anaerobacillus arseniciselenatis]OIJ12269.1 hypothetical protein BKP35_10710 [Anaerobacillus arseniciselenatis]